MMLARLRELARVRNVRPVGWRIVALGRCKRESDWADGSACRTESMVVR